MKTVNLKSKEFREACRRRRLRAANPGLWRLECSERAREITRLWRLANPKRMMELARCWRAANPEKVQEKNCRWRAVNPEKVNEAARRRYAANPEKGRETARRWRISYPSRAKESVRRWRAANSEKVKETTRLWRLANPEKVKEIDRRGHAAMWERRRKEREGMAELKQRWKQSLKKMLPNPALTGAEKHRATFLAKRTFNRRMDRLLIQWAEEKPNEFTI